jgi:hypothetical protein
MMAILGRKMPRRQREWDNIEASESNKAPSQPTGWNPGQRQRKMTMDNNIRTQISEASQTIERKGAVQKTRQCQRNLSTSWNALRWRMKSKMNW